MKTREELKQIAQFVAEYATRLMGSGVHTSRVVRNSKRLGEALGVKVIVSSTQRVVTFSVYDIDTGDVYSEVVDVPSLPISFVLNSELSALSWEACDKGLSLEQIRTRYQRIIALPRLDARLVLLLVSAANASFCRLFGGDWQAMLAVFGATAIGFLLRQRMHRKGVHHFVIVIVVAFAASMCSSLSLLFSSTSEVAIATSVLFLIPGVPLINGVIDMVEGYILNSIARLTAALMQIVCIAIGLSITLMIVKNGLL